MASGAVISAGPASAATTAAPATTAVVNKTLPTITGVFEAGQLVTAGRGTWTVDAKVTYQWFGPGHVPIAGATAKILRIPDGINAVSVDVTGSKAGKSSTTVSTREQPVKTAFTVAKPAIFYNSKCSPNAGAPVVGDLLYGMWNGAADSVKYRWYLNGQPIKEAWNRTYKLSDSAEEAVITLSVTATKAGYKSRTVFSDPLGPLNRECPAVPFTLNPKVVGTGIVGQPLSVDLGARPSGVTFTYQWSIDRTQQWFWADRPIPGATAATYTPLPADAGAKIAVRVTAHQTGYTDLGRTAVLNGRVIR